MPVMRRLVRVGLPEKKCQSKDAVRPERLEFMRVFCDLIGTVQKPVSINTPEIEIAQPKLFKMGAVLIVSAYGLLLAVPIFAAMLIVSLLKIGIMTALVPCVAIVGTAFFLPVGLGNPHIMRVLRLLTPGADNSETAVVVQLTLAPRIRSGLRAMVEDADDFGYLSFGDSGLRFRGDSVKLSIPFECIQEVRPQNVGLRGRFLYGRRIRIVVSGLPGIGLLEFAERSSWLLPSSRRITKQLCQRLARS